MENKMQISIGFFVLLAHLVIAQDHQDGCAELTAPTFTIWKSYDTADFQQLTYCWIVRVPAGKTARFTMKRMFATDSCPDTYVETYQISNTDHKVFCKDDDRWNPFIGHGDVNVSSILRPNRFRPTDYKVLAFDLDYEIE